jgi:hypothetical protein
MRALAVVGVGALVASVGACVGLSGIGGYEACGDSCGDAAATLIDAPIVVDERPASRGDSSQSQEEDVSTPVEEEGVPPTPEASSLDDAQPDDVSAPPPMDSGPDVVTPPIDSGKDVETKPEAGPGVGTTCGPLKTPNHCTTSQICCATLATQMNACATTCAANATIGCTNPTDCPSTAPLCCAHMTLGGNFPMCSVSLFASACAATCADNPPSNLCNFNDGVIRLCAHDKDCSADTANQKCYQFNNAPEAWCTTAAIGAAGGGVDQP